MKKSLYLFLLVLISISSSFAQTVQFKTILDATKSCNTPTKFAEFIKPYGFCFNEKKEMPTFTYYTHFKCGQTDIGQEGLRINFSVSNDGSLNSSFLTRNSDMVRGFENELNDYHFTETTENVDLSRKNATWFTSKEFPDILILWEYNLDNNQQKVWHIGFVWNRPEN
jgi:hypothetical protein